MSVYFVYRSHYEGPLGQARPGARRRVRPRLVPVAWERAKQAEDVSEWLEDELGTSRLRLRLDLRGRTGRVPAAAQDRPEAQVLPGGAPLRRGRDPVRASCRPGPHRRRRDRTGLLLLRRPLPRDNPGRAAYLLHEDWRLPTTSGEVPYKPSIATKEVLPAGRGLGRPTWPSSPSTTRGGLTDLDVGRAVPDRGRAGATVGRIPARTPGRMRTGRLELKLLRSQLRLRARRTPASRAAFGRVARLPGPAHRRG